LTRKKEVETLVFQEFDLLRWQRLAQHSAYPALAGPVLADVPLPDVRVLDLA
jgi:hypothetical protein